MLSPDDPPPADSIVNVLTIVLTERFRTTQSMTHWEATVPLLLFVGGAAALAGILLLLARLVYRGRPNPVKQMPYESGVDPFHDTRRPFDVRFYLVAVAFLVFDVEVLFLYPWAAASGGLGRSSIVAARNDAAAAAPTVADTSSALGSPSEYSSNGSPLDAAVAQGWTSSRNEIFGGVAVFFALLVLGLAYDWRKGVFQWR